MQRFRIKTPMDKQGRSDLYIVIGIQDIIDILKDHDSASTVHSSDIVFDGTYESLHLLQGSLLVNGIDKKVWNSINDKRVNDPYFVYIKQLDY